MFDVICRSPNQGFLERPFIPPVGVAMTVCGEKAAAMPPKQRPDLLAVGLRQGQSLEVLGGEEFKPPLVVRWRQGREFPFHFEEKHEPMLPSFIAVFADKAGQMEFSW